MISDGDGSTDRPSGSPPGIPSLNIPSLGGWKDDKDKLEWNDCFPILGSEHLARNSYGH